MLDAALALSRKGTPDFHGFSLAKTMRTDGDRRALTAHGTLYRTLHRLQAAGLIESFWEDPAQAEKEGRPRRRLYRLTAAAAPALARARQESPGSVRALKESKATS